VATRRCKTFGHTFSRLDITYDEQTVRQTDRQTSCDSIDRAMHIALRGNKNHNKQMSHIRHTHDQFSCPQTVNKVHLLEMNYNIHCVPKKTLHSVFSLEKSTDCRFK